MTMKLQKFILPILFGAVLVACSPRVDDIFDDTAVVRLENRRLDIMKQLMSAPNGWEMQYFAQTDPTASDPEKHQGYNFTMQFREDGTVTVGAMVDGVFKTETSMWDVINDNSNVLTFNTFNGIFHYYSNPDPDLGLWGADGEGIGGDYEFLVLEYNEKENYQLLKGKKNGCYIRMYPLAADKTWEDYFAQIDAMHNFLFEQYTPIEFYDGEAHLTVYDGLKHEFRAFTYNADTLGGGSYYGLIVTTQGLRLHDDKLLEQPVNRAAFNLDESRKKLVSVVNSKQYFTVDAISALSSNMHYGKAFRADDATLPAAIKDAMATLEYYLKNGVGSAKGSAKAKLLGFGFVEGLDDKQIGLQVYYSSNGNNELTNVFYLTKTVQDNKLTLLYEGAMDAKNTLQKYNGEDFVRIFNGTYTLDLVEGLTVTKGITWQKQDNAAFVFTVL